MLKKSKLLPTARLGWTLLLLVLALAGCRKDARVVFIQGQWYNKNAHLANIPGEPAQVTTWEFDHGYFSMDACCFSKMNFSGNYYITDRQENQLTLQLINMKGQMSDQVLHQDDELTLVLKLDTEADTLSINNEGPYTRLSP